MDNRIVLPNYEGWLEIPEGFTQERQIITSSPTGVKTSIGRHCCDGDMYAISLPDKNWCYNAGRMVVVCQFCHSRINAPAQVVLTYTTFADWCKKEIYRLEQNDITLSRAFVEREQARRIKSGRE